MWRQREPLGIFVKIAPTADVAGTGKEKVDRTVEFVGPFSSVRNGAALRVDQDDRTRPDHRVECFIQLPDDAPAVVAGQVVLGRKKCRVIGSRVNGNAFGKPQPGVILERAISQKKRGIGA